MDIVAQQEILIVNQKYERLMTVDIDEVINIIVAHKENSKPHNYDKRVLFKGEKVKLSSLRLQTFAYKGTVCSDCGLHARFFAIERTQIASRYHINMWGINSEGKEVLFTHDHTLARALGGADDISNTTTMCSFCNHTKGIEEKRICESLKRNVE